MREFFRKLHRDESGNVLVLYMAASLLIVGLMWAIIGTGQRLVQKETIQGSADAAVYSAAIVKAKGLNLLAFLNLILAVLLAIIIMMRAVVLALAAAAAICAANCPYGDDELCAATPEVAGIYGTFEGLEQEIEPEIKDAMQAVSATQTAINQTFPALAMLEAYKTGTNDVYKKNFGKSGYNVIGTPLPVGQEMTLPTEEGTNDDLCKQAMNVVDRASGATVSSVGVAGGAGGLFAGLYQVKLALAKAALCPSVPKPRKLVDKWQERKDSRAYAILNDSNMEARRKSVAVASKQKPSAPGQKTIIATAQAEFYPAYGKGHDDLWHMDWRARLVRYTFPTTDDSGALGAFTQILSSVSGLNDYMVH